VSFAHRPHHFDDLSIQQAEIPRVEGDRKIDQPLEQPVEGRHPDPAQQTLVVARNPHSGNDLAAVPPALNEQGYQLGWVLQIRIHHYCCRAADIVQTGGHRHLVAEVAHQDQGPDSRIRGGKRLHHFNGSIG